MLKTQNLQAAQDTFSARFNQFKQILKTFSQARFIKRPEVNDFFNLIDNMLRLVLQISREDNYFREGACLLHQLYSQDCKVIMEREFSVGQLAQVSSQCNTIFDHNKYFEAYNTLKQEPTVLPASLMKRVYEMDKEQGFTGSLYPAERILRQWFAAESKLVGGGFDTLLPVRMYRVFRGNVVQSASFQKQMESCVSDVFDFFKWLLFSSDPFHYKVAQDIVLSEEQTGAALLQQSQNPEQQPPLAESKQMCWTQFTVRVLQTVQRIKNFKEHELHKALFPAPPSKLIPLQTSKLNLTQHLQQQGSTSANPIDVEQFSTAAPNPTASPCEWHQRLCQLDAEFRQARAPEHHEARNKLFQQVVILVNQKDKWSSGSVGIINHLNKIIAEHLTENQRSVVRKYLNSTFSGNPEQHRIRDVDTQLKALCQKQAPVDANIETLWSIKLAIEKVLANSGFLECFRDKKWDLVIYGSALNSIFSNQLSDLDMTLIVDSKLNQNEILLEVQQILEQNSDKFGKFQFLVLPSGPLLSFVDMASDTEVDISVNKILEIQNSRLIRAYAQLEPRFANLALFLKVWNKQRFQDKKVRLNSYTLNLMLVAFLQHVKVLPSLQALAQQPQPLKYEQQGKYLCYSGVSETQFLTDVSGQPRQMQNLSEAFLLQEFFSFYGFEFNEATFAIDIRSGTHPFPRRQDVLAQIKDKFALHPQRGEIMAQYYLSQNARWAYMVVDPFKLDYSPAKMQVDAPEAAVYKSCFQSAHNAILMGKLPL